jgi:hypothetical protein
MDAIEALDNQAGFDLEPCFFLDFALDGVGQRFTELDVSTR